MCMCVSFISFKSNPFDSKTYIVRSSNEKYKIHENLLCGSSVAKTGREKYNVTFIKMYMKSIRSNLSYSSLKQNLQNQIYINIH